MFSFIRFNRKGQRRNLLDIETILASSLKPVSPRPEFIQSLQKGLMEFTFPQSESSEVDLKKVIFFALAGFSGMVFIISLWVRLIVVIISTLGMIQSSRARK